MDFNFNYWIHHFIKNEQLERDFHWEDTQRLTKSEKNLIAPMLAQFQKGERSEGAVFRSKAHRFLRRTEDKSYLEALSGFVREEQRHADLLTRFMEQEQIPALSSHTNDHLFKLIRRMGGLGWTVTVLLAVEVLSMPCFRALKQVTGSRTLRQICDHHLIDETHHLNFQAVTLTKLFRHRSPLFRAVWRGGQGLLQILVAGQAWRSYRPLLQAAGFTKASFRTACLRELKSCLYFSERKSGILEFNFNQTEVHFANTAHS